MMALSSDVFNGNDKLLCLKKQSAETCLPKTWAGLIHFMAFSSVIRRRVHSVYPVASPAIRSLFHGVISPRRANTLNDDIFYIMFTRDSNLNTNPGSRFEPNHFCPLVPMACTNQKGFSHKESDFPSLQETFNIPKKRKFQSSINRLKDDKLSSTKEIHESSIASVDQNVFWYKESDLPSLQETFNIRKIRKIESSVRSPKDAKVSLKKEINQGPTASTDKNVFSHKESDLYSVQVKST